MSEVVKIDIDWQYNFEKDKYDFVDKHGAIDCNPIGKYCAIAKNYSTDGSFMTEEYGCAKNVLYSIIKDKKPRNFENNLVNNCYLIKIESVL